MWQNETKNTAEVVCVIIGFSKDKNKTKYIFDKHGKHRVADDISPYLTDNKPIFIEYNKDPICKVPPIMKGLDFLDTYYNVLLAFGAVHYVLLYDCYSVRYLLHLSVGPDIKHWKVVQMNVGS